MTEGDRLIFNDSLWDVPQRVAVSPVDDNFVDGDQECFVKFEPAESEGDELYQYDQELSSSRS